MPGAHSIAPSAEELKKFYAAARSTGLVPALLQLALLEDLGPERRDLTSELFLNPTERLRCAVVARQPGVVAGLATIPDLLKLFDPDSTVSVATMSRDGAAVAPGDEIATLEGNARVILALERTMLNLLGRLSGVATITRRYRNAMGDGTRAGLFDTRKTTPGLRILEKYAVLCGGGRPHRLGLHDAVLIKDNHLAGVDLDDLAARVTAASERDDGDAEFFEVEVDGLAQFQRMLTLPESVIQIVLLDNFSLADLREAVERRDAAGSGLLLEASGGVTLETIRDIALTGVDRISVGALTHSAVSLDFGLDAR